MVSVSRVKVGSRVRERERDQSRWRLSRSPHYCTSQLSPARLPTGWPRILLLCVVGSSECVNVVLCVAPLLVTSPLIMHKVIIANCSWDLHRVDGHFPLFVSVLCCLWSVEVGQKRKLPDCLNGADWKCVVGLNGIFWSVDTLIVHLFKPPWVFLN